MLENHFHIDIRRLTNDNYVRKSLNCVPILGFFLANIFIILLFNFCLNQNKLISNLGTISLHSLFDLITSFYFIGVVISIVFIKTKWIIKFSELIIKKLQTSDIKSENKNQTKCKQEDSEVIWDPCGKPQFKKIIDGLKTIFIRLIEFFIYFALALRLLFLNIFNETFVLIVFWSFYLFVLSISGIINFPENYDFTMFFSAIGMIGIIAGFFQFYTKNYQEKVTSKIENALLKYMFDYVQKEITASNFLIFFQCENRTKKEILQDFNKKINKPYMNKEELLETIKLAKSRSPLYLTIYNNYSRNFDVLSQFEAFDLYAIENYSGIKKNNLSEMYISFFKAKHEEFVRKMRNDDLNRIRNILLPVILFFDEMDVDLFKLDVLNDSYTSEKQIIGFRENYNKFLYDCYFSLIDDVTFHKVIKS